MKDIPQIHSPREYGGITTAFNLDQLAFQVQVYKKKAERAGMKDPAINRALQNARARYAAALRDAQGGERP